MLPFFFLFIFLFFFVFWDIVSCKGIWMRYEVGGNGTLSHQKLGDDTVNTLFEAE